jgi:hypothetical protein
MLICEEEEVATVATVREPGDDVSKQMVGKR